MLHIHSKNCNTEKRGSFYFVMHLDLIAKQKEAAEMAFGLLRVISGVSSATLRTTENFNIILNFVFALRSTMIGSIFCGKGASVP